MHSVRFILTRQASWLRADASLNDIRSQGLFGGSVQMSRLRLSRLKRCGSWQSKFVKIARVLSLQLRFLMTPPS